MSPNETFSPARAPQVDCFVLLLTRDGSHGLDLSMLTHLFLVDQCWDPAVEQQERSARACRMASLMASLMTLSITISISGDLARLPDGFPDGFPDGLPDGVPDDTLDLDLNLDLR
jgi:hypothetical protein